MNLRKILFILLLSLFFISANGQEYAFGVRGGINQYSIGDINSRGGSIAAGQPDEIFTPNKEIGYQFGVYATVLLDKFFFQPELNYVSLKNTYDFPISQSEWSTSKIEIPLLVGYRIIDPVAVYGGPVINFFGDTNLEGTQTTDFSPGGPFPEKNTYNFNVGIMFKWKRFGADLRYEIGITDTEEELLDINNGAYGVNLVDLLPYTPNMLSLSFTVDVLRTDSLGSGLFSGLFRGNKKCYCPY